MNEHGYIKSVNRHVPKEIYRWKISDRYTAGIPDCWYCGDGGSLWAEYKFLKSLPPNITPALTKLQLHWLRARTAQGQQAIVIVGSPEGGLIFARPDEWDKPIPRFAFQRFMGAPEEIAAWITMHCCKKG